MELPLYSYLGFEYSFPSSVDQVYGYSIKPSAVNALEYTLSLIFTYSSIAKEDVKLINDSFGSRPCISVRMRSQH